MIILACSLENKMLTSCINQDCVCLIAPFSFNDQQPELFNPATDFDMSGDGKVWFAKPQLFFTCLVCPCGHKKNVKSHRKLSLVFFNTFDPIQLSPESVMHEKGVLMLCEDAPGQIPTMYICPVNNVLGRILLIPRFLNGQKHPTFPCRFRKSGLGGAIADSRQDNGTGGRLYEHYEVNLWLWN